MNVSKVIITQKAILLTIMEKARLSLGCNAFSDTLMRDLMIIQLADIEIHFYPTEAIHQSKKAGSIW